jgi:Domain of unknown function (DUF3806)
MRICPLVFLVLLQYGAVAMSAEESEIQFRPLPKESLAHLDKQRSFVASLVAKHLPGQKLEKSKADYILLQRLIDLHAIPADKTWELQSLGVVFGDALASTIPGLAWWEVTDKYGTDPTLRYKQTRLQINALTMISKRIEDGKEVDVAHMAAWLQDFVKNKAHEYK